MSEKELCGTLQSWMWDYFSIKDNAIRTSVCDICHEGIKHTINPNDMLCIRKHLSVHHEDIAKEKIIDLESYFERVQCSTDDVIDSIIGNIKCKCCNQFDMSLRVRINQRMRDHLEQEHNVTIKNWKYLQAWRNLKTREYYNLTWRNIESIGRTKWCKRCGHQFRRSNLIIMIKHLMQSHSFRPYIDLDKLPKGLLQLRYPILDASNNNQSPSTSGNAVSSFQGPVSNRQ